MARSRFPVICLDCEGSGAFNRCATCAGSGLCLGYDADRSVSRAWLCEHCGVRAYDRHCTAPKHVCLKAQERTEYIRSGYVFVQERAVLPDTVSRTPIRVSMDQARDQLEDRKPIGDSAVGHLGKMIAAAELVVTSGRPWWRALLDTLYPWSVIPMEHAYGMVAGYNHTPENIDCEPPERVRGEAYRCRWLVNALARGFSVRYSPKQGALVNQLMAQENQLTNVLDEYPR